MKFYSNLICFFILIFLLASQTVWCQDISKLDSRLFQAVIDKNISKVEKLLKKGANPIAKDEKLGTPIKIAFENTIPKGKSDGILELLTYYWRQTNQEKASIKGELVLSKELLGMTSEGFKMANIFSIKSNDAQYEVKFASLETKFINIGSMSNLFFLKIGGEYQATGTINSKGQLEADQIEYLGSKGDSNFKHSGSDLLPSTFKFYDELYK